MSSVIATMRDKGGVDAATLASNWGIGIKASKRMHLVITQRGVKRMIHPSLTKRFKTNDQQMRYHRLHIFLQHQVKSWKQGRTYPMHLVTVK
jgi:hypothetical protein